MSAWQRVPAQVSSHRTGRVRHNTGSGLPREASNRTRTRSCESDICENQKKTKLESRGAGPPAPRGTPADGRGGPLQPLSAETERAVRAPRTGREAGVWRARLVRSFPFDG
eukprot:5014722-Prymnesium_polylepis.1